MSETSIEKNKLENKDLLQIEYFSDLPVSKKDIIVIEPNDAVAISIHKFLVDLNFENIYICKTTEEAIKIFLDFISRDINISVIIDDSVSNNIEGIVKEILEVQPNSNIIIITKEKTNPQISKLIDMGITSIATKPLNFVDFKNSLFHISEKDTDVENATERNFESLLTLYNQISQNKIKDILKLEQSEVDTIIKKAVENKKIILDKEILEAVCNQCNSTNITYISECPNCHGINFKQMDLIEHYNCGEVYPKEGDYMTCPKCSKNIGSAGTDYREFEEYYACSSCNDRFPRPLFKFTCLECGNMFIEKLASWKKSNIYKIQK